MSVVVRVPREVWEQAKLVGALLIPPQKPAEVLRIAVAEYRAHGQAGS